MISRILFFLLCYYILLVAYMYVMQRQLLYHPSHDLGAPADHGVPDMNDMTLRTEDGLELRSWFAPPKEQDGRIVLFFHGNGGHIGDRAFKAHLFMQLGYGVLLAEYRGYGGNPGTPTEAGFYLDAQAAWDWLMDAGYKAGQVVLYGESIGTGVAVHLAQTVNPRAVILEMPFTSAVDVARGHYFFVPVDLLMKDRYDSLSKIKNVKTDLLILHGDADTVVPYDLGRRLFEAAHDPKEFVTLKGGSHEDLYGHGAPAAISKWMAALE